MNIGPQLVYERSLTVLNLRKLITTCIYSGSLLFSLNILNLDNWVVTCCLPANIPHVL